MGSCILYVSEELEELNKGDGKKLNNLCESRDIERVYVKKSIFLKKSEIANSVSKLCGKQTHATNVAETERPLGYSCIECLTHSLRLLDDDEMFGKYDLRLGSLEKYMRLDSAAAEAVNLLPKADHPSQFGSVFGVLNRCKTKMGSRLLERWLRQPLINDIEINARLDTVEILKISTLYRNRLCDGPLKNIPDLDTVVAK
jgi:DNA mismatch repair protein MSH2